MAKRPLTDFMSPAVSDDIHLEIESSFKTATLRKRGTCGGWGYDFSKGEFVGNYYTYRDHGAVWEHFHVPVPQALDVALTMVIEPVSEDENEIGTPRRDWLETLRGIVNV